MKHTQNGEAVELLVCRSLELTQSGFSTSEYDAFDPNGDTYEIKHTIYDSDRWWNVRRETYQHFFNNIDKIKYIILVYNNNETGDCFLKWRADAKAFTDNIYASSFDSGLYYNPDNLGCITY